MGRIKQAFLIQPRLELFESHGQVACAFRCNGIAVELILSVPHKCRNPSPHDHLHTVFQPKAKMRGTGTEHDAAQYSLRIFQCKIVMPGRVNFIIGQLAAHIKVLQSRHAVQHGFDELIDLSHPKNVFFTSAHRCASRLSQTRRAKTAMPIALSREYSGNANTVSCNTERSTEFDATPPEQSTGNPGYIFLAAFVTR